MPPYGLPHDPGLRSWSSGFSTVSTPSSVEPYTSKRKPSPSLSMISCFSAYGTGAAFAMRQIIDDRSAFASSVVGQRHDALQLGRRREGVGDAVLLHQRDPADRIELAQHDDRRAERVRQRRERERSRVVQRTGREVHRVLVQQAQLVEQREDDLRGRCACAARPWACPVVPDV